jgi:hypothetical protein
MVYSVCHNSVVARLFFLFVTAKPLWEFNRKDRKERKVFSCSLRPLRLVVISFLK